MTLDVVFAVDWTLTLSKGSELRSGRRMSNSKHVVWDLRADLAEEETSTTFEAALDPMISDGPRLGMNGAPSRRFRFVVVALNDVVSTAVAAMQLERHGRTSGRECVR